MLNYFVLIEDDKFKIVAHLWELYFKIVLSFYFTNKIQFLSEYSINFSTGLEASGK